ncbi:MAG: hypothetical protein AAF193_11420 [Bacteroidota bacterium]
MTKQRRNDMEKNGKKSPKKMQIEEDLLTDLEDGDPTQAGQGTTEEVVNWVFARKSRRERTQGVRKIIKNALTHQKF